MSAIEAMKLALEALEWEEAQTAYPSRMMTNAITALQKALANEALDKMAENARELGLDYEPAPATELREQGPGRNHWEDGDVFERIAAIKEQPAQRTWVNATTWRGLTDEERAVIIEANTTDDHGYDIWCDVIGVALAIEAKLKEKNCG
jgi:hypothetical protein